MELHSRYQSSRTWGNKGKKGVTQKTAKMPKEQLEDLLGK